MEEITTSQKENYESILDEIDAIQKEYDQLKKQAVNVNDLLRVLKIFNNPDFGREQIFQVKLKLFNNTYEIYNIYPDAIKTNINAISQEDMIYYYIEIYISQQLHKKLISQSWLIAITISSNKTKINKCINIKNRISNPISIIIPFENTIEDSYLDVHLISPNQQTWKSLKLTTIKIDVSYKFNQTKQSNDIIKINKIHNQLEEFKIKPLQYKFKCNWTADKFVETILINSCHKLDLVKILSKSESINFKLDSINIDFNPFNKMLIIEGSAKELYQLKKYFMENCKKHLKEDFSETLSAKQIKDLKKDVLDELKLNNISLHALLNIYDKYVKFIGYYPL